MKIHRGNWQNPCGKCIITSIYLPVLLYHQYLYGMITTQWHESRACEVQYSLWWEIVEYYLQSWQLDAEGNMDVSLCHVGGDNLLPDNRGNLRKIGLMTRDLNASSFCGWYISTSKMLQPLYVWKEIVTPSIALLIGWREICPIFVWSCHRRIRSYPGAQKYNESCKENRL